MACLNKKFKGPERIHPCPMMHSGWNEEELKVAPCQRDGLCRDDFEPDVTTKNVLLNSRCYCQYGCRTIVIWRHLNVSKRGVCNCFNVLPACTVQYTVKKSFCNIFSIEVIAQAQIVVLLNSIVAVFQLYRLSI